MSTIGKISCILDRGKNPFFISFFAFHGPQVKTAILGTDLIIPLTNRLYCRKWFSVGSTYGLLKIEKCPSVRNTYGLLKTREWSTVSSINYVWSIIFLPEGPRYALLDT